MAFDLYQGKGLGKNTTANVQAVGAAGASVLDLLDKLPEDKKLLSYHIFADNYFSSHRLIDKVIDRGYNYTGTIRKDRIKNRPALTTVEKFKKEARGYHQTIVLKDQTQIVTRWNDNSVVSLISSILRDLPLSTARRFSRAKTVEGLQSKNKYSKKVDIPQPHIINQYNCKMSGVDRFDQNVNHLRVSIGGKKWYWSILTWLVDISVQNSWQLHRKAGGSMSYLALRMEVVGTILREAATRRSRTSSTSPVGLRPGDLEQRYNNLDH